MDLLTKIDKIIKENKSPAYVKDQVIHAIYSKGITDFGKMTNLSISLREKLEKEIGNVLSLKEIKIQKAKNLLFKSDKSITEIAMDLGFSTSQYFATAFKRYTGRTPSSYRKETPQKQKT